MDGSEPLEPIPDPAVDLAEFNRRLNAEFYSTDPGAHFDQRVALLASFADNADTSTPGEFTSSLLNGMDGWQLVSPAAVKDPAQRAQVAAVESLVLGVNACEVYLRQFFAHWDASDGGSPWHELAAQQVPGSPKFNDRVAELGKLREPVFMELVGGLLVGNVAAAQSDLGEEAITEYVRSVAAWTRRATIHLNEFRNSYNAAKHGLASIPSETQIAIFSDVDGVPSEPGRVMIAGTTIETIEYEWHRQSRTIDWQRFTRVFDPVVHLRIASIMAGLISQVWTVGKVAHLGGSVRIAVTPYPDVFKVLEPREGHRPGKFSRPIGVETLDPPIRPSNE